MIGIIKERTLVVVPCYNEAARLDATAFLDALKNEPNLEFVFVDDGSRDATLKVIETLAAEGNGRIHVVGLESNRGKAEAVRCGVLQAFALGASLIGYWDADLATPLDAIGSLAEVLQDPHIALVMGSRVQLLGRRIDRSFSRHYLGRGFATLVGIALGLPVYDTQCGAKLFRASPLFAGVFSQPFRHMWTFDVEILARLLKEEALNGTIHVEQQCVEFPLERWRDQPGSKLRLAHAPRILFDIARLFFDSPRKTPRT